MSPSDVHVVVVSQNADIATDVRPVAEASALADAGFRVSIVGPTGGAPDMLRLPDERVAVRPFALPRAAGGPIGQIREQLQAFARAARVLISVARLRPVHVIHAGNPPDNGWLLCWLLRAVQGFRPAFVYDQHDPAPLLVREKFGSGAAFRLVERVLSLLERLSFRNAALVVFANEPFRARAIENRLLRGEAIVAPNGWRMPATRVDDVPWRRDLPLVAYVGTTNVQDCVLHLVEAVAAITTPMQVVIAGDGDAAADGRRLTDSLGLADRVLWLGWVADRSLIAQLIDEAAVCVAPETRSLVNDVTSFVKVIEYMGAGAAVAAHRLPQTQAIAGDAVEYATDESAQSLAAAIDALLGDPLRRRALGRAAEHRFSSELDWHRVGAPRLRSAYVWLAGRLALGSRDE